MKQIFIALAALTLVTAPVAAKEHVHLELVIATDVSRSIDSDEARLQRQGIAAAFRSKQVIDAIRSGVLRRIAVAYIDYSSRDWNKLLIDWRIISDRNSANAFADTLLKMPLTFGRRTSISDALEQFRDLIDKNDIEGTRRVIDVSGDGAFLVVARDFSDFARAIRKKLVLEIAGLMPPRPTGFIRAKIDPPLNVRPSPNGYTYAKSCDIGERMRDGYWADDDT